MEEHISLIRSFIHTYKLMEYDIMSRLHIILRKVVRQKHQINKSKTFSKKQ